MLNLLLLATFAISKRVWLDTAALSNHLQYPSENTSRWVVANVSQVRNTHFKHNVIHRINGLVEKALITWLLYFVYVFGSDTWSISQEPVERRQGYKNAYSRRITKQSVFNCSIEHWVKAPLSLFSPQHIDLTCLWVSLSSFSGTLSNTPRYLSWSPSFTF